MVATVCGISRVTYESGKTNTNRGLSARTYFVIGLGSIPQNKGTFSGQLERVSYLHSVLARSGGTLASKLPTDDWLTRCGKMIGRADYEPEFV